MAKLLSIDPSVLRGLRELPASERAESVLALCQLVEGFGSPHAHSGIGIRKLGNKLFEARATLALRFVFQDRPADLSVAFLGNHDEIKALLRGGKYR